MIGKYILIFVLQLVFNILRVEEIKFSYENDTKRLIINSILMNSIILCSTFFSLTLMLQGNWFIMISYISGAAVGKWIATTNIFNYRKFILDQAKKFNKK